MKREKALAGIMIIAEICLIIAAIIALCFSKHETFQDLMIFYLLISVLNKRVDQLPSADKN